jgi:iron-sulfur cluster repair protein YtfE (RIC family)
LHELKSDSVLWQLQVFFGELRQANPAVNPVIDRLQADHRRVSVDLDAVEAAADALQRPEGDQARRAVVETLRALEQNLLAHLDYEELSVEATVRRLRDFR